MFIEENTLDDLMHKVLGALINIPVNNKATKGRNSEIFGALLKLNNPLARLSRSETKGKSFSPLGELLWYLSGSNSLEFIQFYLGDYSQYSDDDLTIHGGYGPRIFNMHGEFNQFQKIIDLLKNKPSTRRAVIQLFDASDLKISYNDIPCTCFLQFAIRDEKLNLFVSMRSNDAFKGLPHDIFCFTMIQEIVARSLDFEIGEYYHSVSSLHLYEDDIEKAKKYINEGLQSSKFQMPPMPKENVFEKIEIIKEYENKIRNEVDFNIDNIEIDPYWYDLIILLKIHSLYKNNKIVEIEKIKEKISSKIYIEYVNKKISDGLAKFAKKEL
ncbi:thymidylate synthase [Flavobacterium sp. MDT1-60]|uniref:thymidylate synthase n=1 Tax=Flavobacterium sp. MDT1-60 TaxID=1979344 RepID=UPI00177A79BA|nr:thymidylate synthase [Flavobacterium sp. MDT1-60]QOG03480.1 thymidylate synthase [Flavobacterium sp. MDT1-60]